MSNVWLQSALWMALALVAAMGSLYITISAALFEIVVGAIAGNTIGLPLTDWISYIAGFGAVVLTFLAGTDIDPHVVKRNFGSSVSIGLMGFFAPYIGCLLLAHYGLGWSWPQAQIAGIALSTTSVAVVYAVMVETGYNRTELGKIILAACFSSMTSVPCWRLGSSSRTITCIFFCLLWSPSSQLRFCLG